MSDNSIKCPDCDVWQDTPCNTYHDTGFVVDAPYHLHPLDEVFEYYLTTHKHYNKPPEIIALLYEAFEFAWNPNGEPQTEEVVTIGNSTKIIED